MLLNVSRMRLSMNLGEEILILKMIVSKGWGLFILKVCLNVFRTMCCPSFWLRKHESLISML